MSKFILLKQFNKSHVLYKSLSQQIVNDSNKIAIIANKSIDSNLPVFKTIADRTNVIKISTQELEASILNAESTIDLFDTLLKYDSCFEADNFFQLIKKWTRLTCYDELRNKYFVSAAEAKQIPEQLKQLLVKQTIKQVPHFEWDTCLHFVERLVWLGFDSNERCVRAALQVLKYHINSFGKYIFGAFPVA